MCGVARPSDPAVLRVVMADDWATAPVVREVVDDFERDHPGVRVQMQAAPFSRIPELVAAGTGAEQPYDLAHWHAFAAAAAGLAEPLDDRWEAAGLRDEEYLPGALADVVWLGTRYGVPSTPTRWSCS
jgi:multiple sugar transport system substrate-binding protein